MRAVDEPRGERTSALAEALLVCALVLVAGALVGVFAGPMIS